jgi:tetratricopeptide (TPR) repeat protein
MSLRPKLNSTAGRFLLLTASSVLGLLLIEGAVRMMKLVPPVQALWVDDEDAIYIRSTNAILSHVIRPGGELHHANGRATANSFGLRDRERDLPKPAGTRRIVVLGDSVVEGITHLPDDKTLTRQWESLYPDQKTEVLNLGTAGYCTLAEIELLEQKGLQFKPDIVVLVFVINDFQNFIPEHTVGGGVIPRPAWSKHLFLDSHLFRYLSLRFNWFEFATEGDPLKWNRKAIGENNVVTGLRRLRELANREGFQVLVAAWPRFENRQIVDDPLMPRSPDQLVIERLATMNGLPVLRLSVPFNEHWRSLGPNVVARTHYTSNGDQMHPNVEGARLAAEVFHRAIERGLPAAPPFRARPDDLTAIRVAGALGGNHHHRQQTMERRRVGALLMQGRADEAISYLRRLIAEQPDHPYPQRALGDVLYQTGRVIESIPHLQKTIELEPQNPKHRLSLAMSYVTSSNQPAAFAVLQAGLKVMPNDALLHFNLGYLFMVKDDLISARTHLRRTIAIDPKFPDADWMLERVEAATATTGEK